MAEPEGVSQRISRELPPQLSAACPGKRSHRPRFLTHHDCSEIHHSSDLQVLTRRSQDSLQHDLEHLLSGGSLSQFQTVSEGDGTRSGLQPAR